MKFEIGCSVDIHLLGRVVLCVKVVGELNVSVIMACDNGKCTVSDSVVTLYIDTCVH